MMLSQVLAEIVNSPLRERIDAPAILAKYGDTASIPERIQRRYELAKEANKERWRYVTYPRFWPEANWYTEDEVRIVATFASGDLLIQIGDEDGGGQIVARWSNEHLPIQQVVPMALDAFMAQNQEAYTWQS